MRSLVSSWFKKMKVAVREWTLDHFVGCLVCTVIALYVGVFAGVSALSYYQVSRDLTNSRPPVTNRAQGSITVVDEAPDTPAAK